MKFFKILVAAAVMLSGATSAFAQFDNENYTRVQASYITGSISNVGGYIEPKGVSLGLMQGYSLTDELPVFLEIGANLAWMHSAKDIVNLGNIDGDYKYSNMNIAIPINGVYVYTINDRVAVSGFAGLNCKVNMFCIEKVTGRDKVNWLKKDDMGGRENRGNVFQLGGQIGAGVHLANFYLGWQYQSDFMKLIEWGNGDKAKLSLNYFTVGYQGDIFGLF